MYRRCFMECPAHSRSSINSYDNGCGGDSDGDGGDGGGGGGDTGYLKLKCICMKSKLKSSLT